MRLPRAGGVPRHFICTIELTALKYENHEQTATDERFFGPLGNFRKNFLKKVRKHQLAAQ